jgi:FdrA protein
MYVRNIVRTNEYRDSVILMRASERLRALPGIVHAGLMMGTEANKGVLSQIGILTEEGLQAGSDDLIIAVQALDEGAAATALDEAMEFLVQYGQRSGAAGFRLLDSAVKAMPDANLAVISVPGAFAARETKKALQRGLHVFLFSDNVPVQEEIRLKTMAKERGLLVMGPECGTAIINGVGIGFANAVRRGPVGLVAASGTWLQEVTVLIHRQGLGISQAFGVGGRDLSDAVGGISTLQALDALNADIETKVIALVSKPPGPSTMARVLKQVSQCSKPVVVCFL